MAVTLGELATQLGVALKGPADALVDHLAPVTSAGPGSLTFLGDRRLRRHLVETQAGCVILTAADAEHCPVPALLSNNPYLIFARAARILHPSPSVVGGVHPSAVVEASARVDSTAWIGPCSVVEAGALIGPRVFVGPGCVIGSDVEIGADSRLVARVTLCAGTRVGERALIHPGAVIGREGFGFARDGEQWVRMPQVGRAILGHDVEIGANTTVDRGAIGDTLIGNGVKLDSQIQIGHNVEVGDHTAMAANTGISGSTRIGRNCTIAGAVGMAGHLEIADGVHFTGMAMVTRSVSAPGVYSSGIPAMPSADWRRNVARFRHLDELVRRIKQLETQIDTMKQSNGREVT